MVLNESLTDTLIVYMIVKKLLKPWKEWEAYKVGIIDEKGRKLKKPQTPEEKKAWTLLDRFVWQLKRLLTKFLGQNKLINFFAIAYLLKENYKVMCERNPEYLRLLEEEFKEISALEMKCAYKIVKQIDNLYRKKTKVFFEIKEEEFLPLITEVNYVEDEFKKLEEYQTLEKILFSLK